MFITILEPDKWSFIFGVYRLGNELTFNFGLFGIVVSW